MRIMGIIFAIIFEYIIPLLGLILFIIVVSPIRTVINEVYPNILSVENLIAVFIFLCTTYFPLLLKQINEQKIDFTSIFTPQDTIIQDAFRNLSKKNSIDILIYTSYSIFSKYDHLVNSYPKLQNAKMRLLIKDPDDPVQIDNGNKSTLRVDQFCTAISSIRSIKNNNIDVRLYSNDPWLRGISINNDNLYLSTYTIEKKDDTKTYSGSGIPWMHFKNEVNSDHQSMIEGFSTLFKGIWENSIRKKNVVLDLQGTMFQNESYLKIFNDIVYDYLDFKITDLNENESKKTIYNQILKNKNISSTGALMETLYEEKMTGDNLKEYLTWKDQKINLDSKPLSVSSDLIKELSELNKLCRVIILTNHTEKHTMQILKHLKVNTLIQKQDIISLDKSLLIKPDKGLINYLVNKLNLDLSRTIFIGDRKNVDLDYVKEPSLGLIEIKNTDALPDLLALLKYSYIYTKHTLSCKDIVFHK